ncbi:MAG: hypothetical protein RL324_537 [Verrucomicrobiota bacterium]|jgi:hypothetical protein
MKLKSLALAVAVLAVLSAVTWFVQRPAPVPPADPRLGQPLLSEAVLKQAAKLVVSEAAGTVTVVKGEGDKWTVANFHDFPADLSKLIRLVDTLQEAKLERLVTTSPSYIARLGFGASRLALQDAAGKEIWGISLGKLADKGGTFVQFTGETKAFLGNFTAYLDSDPANWADRQLVDLKTDSIATLELNFPEENGRNARFTRAKVGDAFTTDGFSPRQDTLNNLVALHTSVTYTETEAPDSAGARAAQPRSRTVRLTTFDGKSVTLTYAQKAAPKVEQRSDQGEVLGAPEPVYVSIVNSDATATVNALMKRRAFRVQESLFTNLPAKLDDLVDRAPPPPASLSEKPAAPAAPTSGPASGFRMPGK